MGACLVVNNIKEHDNSTRSSPNSIRAEIAQQLVEDPVLGKSSKRPQEEKVSERKIQTKGSIRSRKTIKDEVKEENGLQKCESDCSLRAFDIENDSSPRPTKQAVFNKNPEKTLNDSVRGFPVEYTEENYGDSSVDQESKGSKQHLTKQDSEIQIETPQSRVTKIDENMFGKGVTETDNKMIELTMAANRPLKLNAIRFKNGSIYSGEWMHGKRQGNGVIIWEDGERYEGEWKENCSSGKGKLIYSEHEYYEGDFMENSRHGFGVYVHFGVIYSGQWKNDKQQGRGVQKWGINEYYEGEWQGGQKNGKGEIHFEDGSFYKGDFAGNEIHGFGYYEWKNLKTYEGQWQHNRMNGKGIIKFANGDQYEGQLKNDKMHGEGVFTLADGSSSTGIFQNGKKHGFFTETDPDNGVKVIQYYLGKLKKDIHKYPSRKNDRNTSKTSSATQSF